MASGGEDYGGGDNGSKLKDSTAASRRNPKYTAKESNYMKSSSPAPF
jgi:hypothetical protein